MNALGVRPSFATGFAQGPGESEYPELWRGLVAAYDPSLGQTGGRLIDWSGKGNHGTFEGTPIWIPGGAGSAIEFGGNGSGDRINLGDKDLFSFGNGTTDSPFSIVAMIYVTGIDGTLNWIITKDHWGSIREWQFLLDVGKPTITCWDDSVSPDTTISRRENSVIPLNSWQLLIATYNGNGSSSGLQIHRNGVRVDDTNSSQNEGNYVAMEPGSVEVFIGDWAPHSLEFEGLISQIMIYNRVLIPAEISLLHQLRKQVA